MNELTTAQRLLPAKNAIGRPVFLLPYQTLVSVKIEADTVSVLVRMFAYTEKSHEVRFTKSGLKLRQWYLNSDTGKWAETSDPIIMWDDEFTPFIEARYGTHRSPVEHWERIEHEALCFRPGNSHTELDSFDRTAGGQTTKKMFRHWTGTSRQDFS